MPDVVIGPVVYVIYAHRGTDLLKRKHGLKFTRLLPSRHLMAVLRNGEGSGPEPSRPEKSAVKLSWCTALAPSSRSACPHRTAAS